MMLFTVACFFGSMAAAVELPVIDIEAGCVPAGMLLHDVVVTPQEQDGAPGLRVDFGTVEWPNVMFTAPAGSAWDWSAHGGLAVELFNPTGTNVDASLRVDNPGADGMNHCNTLSGHVPPGESTTLWLRFNFGDNETFWGMRGVPERGPVGTGPKLDLKNIVAFQVFVPRPQQAHTLIIKRAYLFGAGGDLSDLVALPFVDRFGQYRHQDWPGKVHEAAELGARRDEEEAALSAQPELPGRDRFGGWAAGPQLEATGWFRTEQLQGKWWLVTPEGHVFFSIGMDCVGTWEQTFVEKREAWFEWLPEKEDPVFGGLYAHASGVHSMAEPIGGAGRTFSFYRANLVRKDGAQWAEAWRDRSAARLRAWGFNTIGSWSQGDVISGSSLPYVTMFGSGNVPVIEAAQGYWAKMMDVYHPDFERIVNASVEAAVRPHAGEPRCIGYFSDNELAWEGIVAGTLNSSPAQACRQQLIAMLQTQYGRIEGLNAAWGTAAKDWDALRYPATLNKAAAQDLDAYLETFATRYFRVIREAIRRHAPHQLYLGCRFATAPPAVVRACANEADVVSFNLYYREIPCAKFEELTQGKKPIIIGEFHFGALDRGMFHTGLVPTENQQARAAQYRKYVESVADCPLFVGCHWFQYVDEPTTGRTWDGENYNIGFVDVTDTPYPELVEAARGVHAELYERRLK